MVADCLLLNRVAVLAPASERCFETDRGCVTVSRRRKCGLVLSVFGENL